MATRTYPVYGTPDNWFFSEGVTREMGENRRVRLNDGRVVANVVQPLKEHHRDLPVVGEIVNADDGDGTERPMNAREFAASIIEGPGGMNSWEEREVVAFNCSERIAAVEWTLRCLANPDCEGSEEALAAIIEKRNQAR